MARYLYYIGVTINQTTTKINHKMQTTIPLTTQQQEAAINMAIAIKTEVSFIERQPKVSQNNYTRYMGILNKIAKNKPEALVVAHALILAGANSQGVTSAFNLLY